MAVATPDVVATPATLDRPFYFIVVLWGERFRSYFLDYCLASVLSPGNIPALSASRRSKFLIATRPEDWAAMRDTPIFRLLERYIEPVYIEIPPCPPGNTGCQHMGVGHRIACEMAHRDKAYVAVLTPDSMLSDGSVARLQELAKAGIELVLTAALRFGEEPFLANLRKIGAVPEKRSTDDGRPLTINGRQMVYAAVNGFHSQTLAYEWDTPGLLSISPAAWWRVPGEDGIVLHSLSWAPLLLDYGAIADHDTSTFDQWTLDGDYLFRNSGDITRIHVVQDSDEIFLSSWGPLSEGPLSKFRFPFDRMLAGPFFQQSFYSGFFDPLKRKLFFKPVRWHARPLNDEWSAVEQHAMHEILRWAKPPDDAVTSGADAALSPGQRILAAMANLPLSALRSLAYAWMFRSRVRYHIGRMLRGDRQSFARIAWFARSFIFALDPRSRTFEK